MKLKIGSQTFTIKLYLIKRCGDTDNVGFRVYRGRQLIKQFNDGADLGMWIVSVIIAENLEAKLEEK